MGRGRRREGTAVDTWVARGAGHTTHGGDQGAQTRGESTRCPTPQPPPCPCLHNIHLARTLAHKYTIARRKWDVKIKIPEWRIVSDTRHPWRFALTLLCQWTSKHISGFFLSPFVMGASQCEGRIDWRRYRTLWKVIEACDDTKKYRRTTRNYLTTITSQYIKH